MNTFPLCELKRGETGIIRELFCPPEQTSQKAALVLRLLDLGFCENTPVTCVNLGIFKNPHAYLIRGSVIALRNQDAQMILIEKAPKIMSAQRSYYEKKSICCRKHHSTGRKSQCRKKHHL